ncbi:MAG: hypothetical protein A3H29_12325 [Acidobacteria bacterium RIFCSPLOWO2_02_FULL_67_21]|nr:MAG: hypothetical protein A3H29_12325 [Acidobacteria bacterium RIFCSPLOWO2_02_FULL_67_21]
MRDYLIKPFTRERFLEALARSVAEHEARASAAPHADRLSRLAVRMAVALTLPLAQERFDGTGFPLGLHGSDIPLGARIIAVADAYDSLSATGAGMLTPSEAFGILIGQQAGRFDPAVLEALREAERGLQSTAA